MDDEITNNENSDPIDRIEFNTTLLLAAIERLHKLVENYLDKVTKPPSDALSPKSITSQITIQEMVIELVDLNPQGMSSVDIGKVLVSKGVKINSVSPAIHHCLKDGRIEAFTTGQNKYIYVPKGTRKRAFELFANVKR